MGNYLQNAVPEEKEFDLSEIKPAKEALFIIYFASTKIHLKFEKSKLFQNPNIKIDDITISIKFFMQDKKILLGSTLNNYFEIELPDEVRKYIEKSNNPDYEISFLCSWEDGKKTQEQKCQINLTSINLVIQKYEKLINNDEALGKKLEELKKEIKAYPVKYSELRKINILMAGPTKAGKSSLFNSFNYLLKDIINQENYSYFSKPNEKLPGITGTTSFKKCTLFNWLNLWDSPGFLLVRTPLFSNIFDFWWDKHKLKSVCTSMELIDKEENLSKLKMNSRLPLEDQIHSVIFVWNYLDQGLKHK